MQYLLHDACMNVLYMSYCGPHDDVTVHTSPLSSTVNLFILFFAQYNVLSPEAMFRARALGAALASNALKNFTRPKKQSGEESCYSFVETSKTRV